jgi:hypothetical protein
MDGSPRAMPSPRSEPERVPLEWHVQAARDTLHDAPHRSIVSSPDGRVIVMFTLG